MRVFQVTEGVFKTEPLFILGCSHVAMRRYLKRRFDVSVAECQDDVLGMMITLPKAPWRVVWAKRNNTITVLHEVVHLATRICFDRGIPIVAHHPDGTNGDETAAYLVEFFMEQYFKRRR